MIVVLVCVESVFFNYKLLTHSNLEFILFIFLFFRAVEGHLETFVHRENKQVCASFTWNFLLVLFRFVSFLEYVTYS